MSVTEEWSALLEVLEHAPSMSLSFRPAPAKSEVERAESLTAAVWPDQVREFHTCHGGQSADDFGVLLPMSELFGLERMLEEHRMMVEISQQWIEHDPESYSPNGAADLAVDDLTDVLVASGHPRAGELLTALAEDEPPALCRAVDRWARDERPSLRAAAAR